MDVPGLTRHLRSAAARVSSDPDTVLVMVKTIIAGTVAWALATRVFHASHATFAAFAAMLLMHHTIAESVEKAVRYTAAVLVGIALAGTAALPWGTPLWLFPLIVTVTLVIGRWRRLDSQGFNVTVAAIFAFGVIAMPDAEAPPLKQVRDLATMVLLGAVVAVTINLLIAPPLRYRSAKDAVQQYGESVAQLFRDVADGLGGGVPDSDAARDWRRRGEGELPRLASQARRTVGQVSDTSKLNPRRLVVRRRSSFDGYRLTVHGIERIADQMRAVTASLARVASEDGDPGGPQSSARCDFLRNYTDVLTGVGQAVIAAAAIHTVEEQRCGQRLADAARRCGSALQALGSATDSHRLDLPYHWAVYGALYTDAQRLCEEVESLHHALTDGVQP